MRAVSNSIYELTDEQRRLLSREEQEQFLEAMADWRAAQELAAADPTLRSESMPRGKNDFPPLGVDVPDRISPYRLVGTVWFDLFRKVSRRKNAKPHRGNQHPSGLEAGRHSPECISKTALP
jgi:hypothetical protein